jgi:hypothetical protein
VSRVERTLCVVALLAALLVAAPVAYAQDTPEPTVPSSRFRFWTMGMTPPNPELSFYWTPGDGEGAIVVMHEGVAVDADPVDGVVYTDNLTFASGEEIGTGNRVVYQGSATQIVVTVPNTDVTYHVAVYEYNGSGTGPDGIDYLQTSPATGRSGHNAAHGIDCVQCHFAVGNSHGTFLRTPRDGQQETICLSCHSELGDASAKADVAIHTGPNYSVSVDCGSCHMAHNNFDFTTTDTHSGGSTAGNIEWIRPDTTKYVAGALEPALFQANTGFFAFDDSSEPWNGICQTCHTGTDRHTNDNSQLHAHEVTSPCVNCHEHKTGFSPGDCVGCHSQGQPTSAPTRRQITETTAGAQDGEFASGASGFRSHHVNDGSADQVVTKWDCVVCHAEGNALTGAPDDTYHKKDGVQLKDTDTGAVYSNWADLAAWQRSDFCLSCHDINGATIIQGRTDSDPDATTNPLNPFNDGLTNAHEPAGLDGTPAPHSRGAVVDVDAQFDTANVSHHAALGPAYVSASDCVGAGDPHACCTGSGTGPTCALPFSSGVDNAIQGVRIDLAWDSMLDCEDCHYGTPTTMLSGHGTPNARYMLRDKDGNDTLAVDPNTICYRCHSPADAVSVYPEHDKGAHINDSLNIYGIACLNCHGGGTWGGIHGVNDPVTDDGGAGSFTPNVFTYGAGLDYISNWTSWANRGVSCSSKSGADRINSCDHHSSTTSWSRGETRTYRAP